MTEEQAKALKVGDWVQYVGESCGVLLNGERYFVNGHDSDGDPFIVDDRGDKYFLYGEYLEDFELTDPKPPAYKIEIIDTGADFDGTGMVRIAAYVNDELLGHLRDIEAEQGRETKRAKIREQIAKLEAELESLG